MRRNHIVIGAVAFLAIAIASVALIVDPGFLQETSSPLVAFGLVTVGITGLGGLLLARAPWGRWTLTGAVVASMALISGSDTPLVWATYAVGGVSLVLLLGPWINLWIRHHAAADSPGPVPIILMAVGAAAPLTVGLLATEGAGLMHWTLVAISMLAALLYGRGNSIGHWLLRTAVPVAGVVLLTVDNQAGNWIIAALSFGVGVLAFLPAAGHTVVFITPPLPAPVERKDAPS